MTGTVKATTPHGKANRFIVWRTYQVLEKRLARIPAAREIDEYLDWPHGLAAHYLRTLATCHLPKGEHATVYRREGYTGHKRDVYEVMIRGLQAP